MKKIIFLGLAAFTVLGSTAQTKPAAKAAPKPKPAVKPAATKAAPTTSVVALKNGLDSLSYAIGVLDASFFKQQGITKINYEVMMQAVKTVLENKTPVMEPQTADQVLRTQLQASSQKKIQPTIDACQSFLDKNKQRPEIKTTASGLQYEVIKLGTGPMPKDTNRVKVHYTGSFIDGKKFESSKDGAGQPVEFMLNAVIPGWTEGVQLMPVGSTFKFYIPYNLAYGPQGQPPVIPGGAALIFEVDLLEIVPAAAGNDGSGPGGQ